MKTKTIVALFVSAIAVGACNNPFPAGKDAQFTNSKPELQRIFPALSLQVSSLIEFTEGEPGEFEIFGSSSRGAGLMTVNDLPGSAVFNPETRKINWTPSFSDGNNPENPDADSRAYSIIVRLFSETDANAYLERQVTLLVRDVKRPMLLFTNSNFNLVELQPFTQEVILASQDFPASAVNLYSADLPQGATISRDPQDAARFLIQFTPGINIVSTADPRDNLGHFKDFAITLHGIGPRGQVVTKVITWRVRDQRRPVLISAPSQLTVASQISFTVVAASLNVDGPPQVYLVQRPEAGTVAVEPMPSVAGADVGGLSITWTGIPASVFGTTQQMVFMACPAGAVDNTSCVHHKIDLIVTNLDRPAPRFDRSAWEFGVKKEMVVGATETLRLPIQDAETLTMLDRVMIEQSNQNCELTWTAGELRIRALNPGLMQFNIVAISPFGVSQRESFVVEVLPNAGDAE